MHRCVIFLLLPFVSVSAKFHLEREIDHTRDYTLLEDDSSVGAIYKKWHQEAPLRFKREVGGPSFEEIETFIDTYQESFDLASAKLREIVGNDCVLTGRLKSAVSLQEKLVRKSEDLKEIKDIIGLRLTCQTVNDTLRITRIVEKQPEIFAVEEKKCYGICQGAGKYRDTGYRRVHLILILKSTGKPLELQLGTPYCNMWSDWNHDMIYKGPKYFSENEQVMDYSLSLADYFYEMDERRRFLPFCPRYISEKDALQVLRDGLDGEHAEKTYKKLGSPDSACFEWNDMKLALKAPGQCDLTKEKSRNGGAKVGGWIWLVMVLRVFIAY